MAASGERPQTPAAFWPGHAAALLREADSSAVRHEPLTL